MTIRIVCPECETPLKLADTLAGKKTRCPKCKSIVAVPAEEPEEEAEDPQPKKKKKKKRAGSRAGWIIGLGVVVGVLLLIGGIFLLVSHFNWRPLGLGGDGVIAEMTYYPDDTGYIYSARNSEYRDFGLGQIPATGQGGGDKGWNVGEAERVTFAARSDFKEAVIITTYKKAIKIEDVKAARKGSGNNEIIEETVGSYKIYIQKGTGFGGKEGTQAAFCVPESRVLLSGDAATLRTILKRNKKPELSSNMQKALAETDFNCTEVEVRTTKIFGTVSITGKDLSEQEGMVTTKDFSATTIKHKMIVFYKDEVSAEKAKKEHEDLVKTTPGTSAMAEEVRNSTSVSRSGSTLTITYRHRNPRGATK